MSGRRQHRHRPGRACAIVTMEVPLADGKMMRMAGAHGAIARSIHRRRGAIRASLCLLMYGAATAAGTDPGAFPTPEELEAANARIGKVIIEPHNIFNTGIAAESKWFHRLANALHIVTRPGTVRNQLLFREGDDYSARLVDESKRLLRDNVYLNVVDIDPVAYEGGVVDLLVSTQDVWTLAPEVSFGRAGGENDFAVGIKEKNLLGTGAALGIRYKSTVDRDTLTLNYDDRHFRGTRNHMAARYAENSDGYERRFSFGQPFYALDVRHAYGVSLAAEELIEPLYDRGESVSEFGHRLRYHEISVGRSPGLANGWTHRYVGGFVYDDHAFWETPDTVRPDELVPPDRRYIYPYVGFQIVEDRFDETFNFDQIGIVEDRFLGRDLAFRLGYSATAFGSSEDAWHFSGRFADTLISDSRRTLAVGIAVGGRYAAGDTQNMLWSFGVRSHTRLSQHQLFFVSVSGELGRNLDLDNPIVLGGDSGLRGYPIRYQGGDSKLLLTVEQRLYTNWFPWHLFNVGGAVYFDMGRTWGENPGGGTNLGWLKDVGIGLRLGNNRVGDGRVLHVDVAFPLDGDASIDSVQILLNARSTF